jgi:hypothetical protein
MALALIVDLLRLLRLIFRSRARLAAENLFLRKQLACYVERKVRPKGADNASRVALVLLSRFVARRELLTIVRPDTAQRTQPFTQAVINSDWLKARQGPMVPSRPEVRESRFPRRRPRALPRRCTAVLPLCT